MQLDTFSLFGLDMNPGEFRRFFGGKITATLIRDTESIQACSLHLMSLMNENWTVVAKTVRLKCSVCKGKVPDKVGRENQACRARNATTDQS